MKKATPTLSCRSISKIYRTGGGSVTAVSEVDLDIMSGELTAVVGPSGCGKTTLLSLLGGLERPSSVEVLVDGEPLERRYRDLSLYRREKIGFVFQTYNLMPHLTAMENVLWPMELAGRPRAGKRQRAAELMEAVGIPAERFNHRPLRLSGGEQQRVTLARALANEPPVLLADEPTGNLDAKTSKQVINLLRKLASEMRLSVVVVTHDSDIASRADRIVKLSDGRIESDERSSGSSRN